MRTVVLFVLSILSLNLFSRGSKTGVVFDLGYALSYINPSDINAKILDEKAGIYAMDDTISGISWGSNFYVSGAYVFKYRYQIGLALDVIYIHKFVSTDFPNTSVIYAEGEHTGKYFEFNTGVLAYGIGPVFNYSLYDKGKLNVVLSLALLYYLSFQYFQDVTYGESATDDDLNVNLVQKNGSGSTFGGILAVYGNYYMTNSLALGLGLGYKYVQAPALVDENGAPLLFTWLDGSTEENSEMNIPVGGPFISLALRFDFNLGGKFDSEASSDVESVSDDFVEDTNDEVTVTDSEDFVEDSTIKEKESSSAIDDNVVVRREVSISISDLYRLKSRTSKKYLKFKKRRKYRCARRMKRLYDIIEKIEIYQWDKLNDRARQEKLEKINKILNSC